MPVSKHKVFKHKSKAKTSRSLAVIISSCAYLDTKFLLQGIFNPRNALGYREFELLLSQRSRDEISF